MSGPVGAADLTGPEAPLVTFAKSMGEDGEKFAVLFALNEMWNLAAELGLVRHELRVTAEGERILKQAIGYHEYVSNQRKP